MTLTETIVVLGITTMALSVTLPRYMSYQKEVRFSAEIQGALSTVAQYHQKNCGTLSSGYPISDTDIASEGFNASENLNNATVVIDAISGQSWINAANVDDIYSAQALNQFDAVISNARLLIPVPRPTQSARSRLTKALAISSIDC